MQARVPCGTFVLLYPTSLFCTATVGQAEQWSAARRDLVALVGRHPPLNLVMPYVSKASFHLALGCVLFLSYSNTRWQWLAKWLCCCSFSQQIFNDLNVHHKCPLSCCPRTGYTHMNVSRTQHRAIITWHRLRFLTFVEVWRHDNENRELCLNVVGLAKGQNSCLLELHVPSQAKRFLRCGNRATKHTVKLSNEKTKTISITQWFQTLLIGKTIRKVKPHYYQTQKLKDSFLMSELFIEVSDLKWSIIHTICNHAPSIHT